MFLDELNQVDTDCVQNRLSDKVVAEELDNNRDWRHVWTLLRTAHHHFLNDLILPGVLLLHLLSQHVQECLNDSFNGRIVL